MALGVLGFPNFSYFTNFYGELEENLIKMMSSLPPPQILNFTLFTFFAF